MLSVFVNVCVKISFLLPIVALKLQTSLQVPQSLPEPEQITPLQGRATYMTFGRRLEFSTNSEKQSAPRSAL